jgi:hypothetical protein
MSGIDDISPHLDLYRCWDAKRDGRPQPTRRDVDPCEIGRLLRHIALIERSADGYRWRLMGTAIAADIGSDLTGRRFGESVGPPGFVKKLTAGFDRVLGKPQPIFEQSQYTTARGDRESVSRLLLPLGPDDRTGAMVLLTRLVRPFCRHVLERDRLAGACGTVDCSFEIGSLEELDRRALAWVQRGPSERLPRTPGTIRVANLWGEAAVPYAIQD